MRTSWIETDDVRLRVEHRGPSEAPAVLLLHGFPDHRGVWDPVADRLGDDHHVVTVDVRGSGDSEAPRGRSGYRIERLVDDVAAVVAHALPGGRPVHLVGHDWGSIQGWAVLERSMRPESSLSGRIATFTSISGPSLEAYGEFVRSGLRRGRVLAVGRQLVRSWYAAAFQLPVLPELVLGRWGPVIADRLAHAEGLAASEAGSPWDEGFVRDAVHGVNLYRANLGRVLQRPTSVDLPVQLVVPTRDRYVLPHLHDGLERHVPNLSRVELVAGHWAPRTQPELVADLVRGFVAEQERPLRVVG
ncbi:hypothetical protein GCM10009821_17360 [Aeromicrobium halocynthiae]|uniref:AB hydrolase-1 domain-containing protein n=1 Tax=Aeromicrobium halocynthiae TaxID=560557 RepID=A0ABN2VZM5_9ACTN